MKISYIGQNTVNRERTQSKAKNPHYSPMALQGDRVSFGSGGLYEIYHIAEAARKGTELVLDAAKNAQILKECHAVLKLDPAYADKIKVECSQKTFADICHIMASISHKNESTVAKSLFSPGSGTYDARWEHHHIYGGNLNKSWAELKQIALNNLHKLDDSCPDAIQAKKRFLKNVYTDCHPKIEYGFSTQINKLSDSIYESFKKEFILDAFFNEPKFNLSKFGANSEKEVNRKFTHLGEAVSAFAALDKKRYRDFIYRTACDVHKHGIHPKYYEYMEQSAMDKWLHGDRELGKRVTSFYTGRQDYIIKVWNDIASK